VKLINEFRSKPISKPMPSRSSLSEIRLATHGRAIHSGTKRECRRAHEISGAGGAADARRPFAGPPPMDPKPTSILACPECRQRGWRHYHLLATSDTARACPHDLASGVARHNVAPTFRTGISSDCRGEVILWTDIGTHHVMKHRKNLQPFGAASRAHRLVPFNLHRVALRATSAASCSIKPEETDQHVGDAGGKLAVVHANVDRGVQRRR
jgi:hypothetical protein